MGHGSWMDVGGKKEFRIGVVVGFKLRCRTVPPGTGLATHFHTRIHTLPYPFPVPTRVSIPVSITLNIHSPFLP